MAADGWMIQRGDSPVVAAAIHDGHFVRSSLRPFLAISDAARLREEDPRTGNWTEIAATRIVGLRSRFEVDLNRPREKAVYLQPQDSWGLKVWNEILPEALVNESLALYDRFYADVEHLLQTLVTKFGRVVVYDLHTYNHRRLGPYAEPDDPQFNPQVNVGTGTMDRMAWTPVVDRFLHGLRRFEFLGGRLDVRENVKFFGGQLAKWIHGRFPGEICVFSVEYSKFFMNEWNGEVDETQCDAIRKSLASTVPGVLEVLEQW